MFYPFPKLISKTFLLMFLFCVIGKVEAFEILAIGTSNTNCKNVDRALIFSAHLERLLIEDGFQDVKVINAGVNGDTPFWMSRRLVSSVKSETKLVLLEPGPNEKNKARSLEDSAKMLSYLKELKMPTIYVSNGDIQKFDEAKEFAERFGASIYGDFARQIPRTPEFRQFDDPGAKPGHLTAQGCELWAKNILPLVKKVLVDNGIK